MSYDITLVYPDCDTSTPGLLYLPGEPVHHGWGITPTCELCSHNIDRLIIDQDDASDFGDHTIGDHRGVIGVIYSPMGGVPEDVMEYVHLRCVLDAADMGSIGFITQAAEFAPTGKHVAA